MILRHQSIGARLALFILTSCALIFIIIFAFNYIASSRILTKQIEDTADDITESAVYKIESVLCSITKVPQNFSYFVEQFRWDKESLEGLLERMTENNPEIYGMSVSFEPHAVDPKSLYFAPYAYKKDGKVELIFLGDESYRYFFLDWYQMPKELGTPVWSEPYYDEGGGNIMMSTYSVPFYRTEGGNKKFMGVVTADVSLAWLQEIVASIKIAKTGYGFLVSRNGTIVTHPEKKFIMNETLFSVAEERNDPRLREIGRDMIRGRSGYVSFKDFETGKQCWLFYAPVPSTGWSLAVIFPQEELMGGVTRLNEVVIGLGLVGLILLSAVIVFISGTITRPLKTLVQATKDIARGHWDFELTVKRSGDEVELLSYSFVHMRDALKKYIRDLTETTAIKERMQSELQIAHDIQMSILPKIFPPFPHRQELDLYAVLASAREVGGDLYDFFLMDENRLCFVIGDVSGKGVPASLFMAVTKTLIKASAKEHSEPDEILKKVNIEISRENPSCTFVTVFCGILNMQTGEVVYANGGHNPPLVLRRGKEPEFLRGGRGMAVGVWEEAEYEKGVVSLRTGDMLYLYTDGVTEASNAAEELFSEERLQAMLRKEPPASLKEFVEASVKELKDFAGAEPQSDDITIMILRYLGNAGKP